MGMNSEPMLRFLDPTDVWAVMHKWLRTFYFFWRLFQHLNAREAFEDGVPNMRPDRGNPKGELANWVVELARLDLIKQAKLPPIKMLVDSPDPYGNYYNYLLNQY